MKHTICAVVISASLLFANSLLAQESNENKKNTNELNKKDELTEKLKKRKAKELTITSRGISIHDADSASKTRMVANIDDGDDEADANGHTSKSGAFTTWAVMFDLGVNSIRDNTNYANPAVKSYMNVPFNQQNGSLFDLNPGKSINTNIYPWMIKFRALKTHNQRLYISSGLGLQLYNFRYELPLTYTRGPQGVILDTIAFKKDKLGIDYLNVPLLFTFKTRLHHKTWLVYGAGITEGYRIASWNKQVSGARGKVKIHDSFGLTDFNTCISGEIGIEGVVRFFASYQVTSLYGNGIDQHPVSFGLRFSGM